MDRLTRDSGGVITYVGQYNLFPETGMLSVELLLEESYPNSSQAVREILMNLSEYEDLGTVEELTALLQKQTPIPVIKLLPRSENDYYDCPACGSYLLSDCKQSYCRLCGQALDWGREAAEKALEEQSN